MEFLLVLHQQATDQIVCQSFFERKNIEKLLILDNIEDQVSKLETYEINTAN